MFGVIKLSHDSLDRDPTPQRVGGRVSRVIAASLRGARVRLRWAIASCFYDSPVTVEAFLVHSLPLVLIAAVSPVLFLNASRVV